MNRVISKVQSLTEERDKMMAEIISLTQEFTTEKAKKLKVVVDAEKVIETLREEREDRSDKEAWY
ncbi:hypothetical protein SESBI_28868 [Sesbania bispinosa]|nr:hypothetical protein SESBI_28868 [Sesbania bispinosa]